MKKYLRTILCLVLALSMIACFAGCDKDSDGGKKDKKESVAGTYYFYEMESDGETLTREDAEAELEGTDIELDEYFYLELNEDGTGTLCNMGYEQDMEWDEDYIWPEGDEDEKAEYSVKNGKLTIENDGDSMTFKKD